MAWHPDQQCLGALNLERIEKSGQFVPSLPVAVRHAQEERTKLSAVDCQQIADRFDHVSRAALQQRGQHLRRNISFKMVMFHRAELNLGDLAIGIFRQVMHKNIVFGPFEASDIFNAMRV